MAVPLRSRPDAERVDLEGYLLSSQRERADASAGVARPMRSYAELVPEPGVGDLRFRDFPYQEEWYSEEVAAAEEVVWRKATQVGMCLAPATRVLMADLSWRAIGALVPGEKVMGVDEEARAGGRRLRVARVTAKWHTRRPSRTFTFADGRQLVMSPEHRMLTQRGRRAGTNLAWRAASRLRAGQQLRSVLLPPIELPTFEDGWMSGLLDGEGCLRDRAAGAELVITQCHGAVYDRAVAYLRERGYSFGERLQENGVGRISIGRGHDVLRLLSATRPSLRRDGWWAGMRVPGTYGHGAAAIVSIEDDAEPMGMVDIETSTGSFIAEGFISHNSAFAWRWAVRQADQFGETGIYIFPTDTHVSEFGDERIEPAIEESAYLRSRIQKRFVRHKKLKRIGRGFLHLRGSNSKAGAQSVAAQFIVFDEYDFLDPQNLPQIERRISGARQLGLTPRIRRLGTPTVDGQGISLAWEGSDQRVWMVLCEGCGLQQQVTWEENVRWTNPGREGVMRAGRDDFEDRTEVDRAWRACAACEAELDVTLGSWEAQRPGRRVIGFQVPRLIVPKTDLRQIIIASRSTRPMEVEAFENNDLGRPYSAVEAGLDAGTIIAACQQGGEAVFGYAGVNPVTMGVDVAGERMLSVRVSEQLPAEHPDLPNARRALWIGEVSSFREVEAMMHAFSVSMCAIDANPERRMVKTLMAAFPGRVVMVEYDDRNESESIKITSGERGTPMEGVPLKARVNRTEAIDAMMDSIRQLRNFPLADPPQNYVAQLRAPKRKLRVSQTGKVSRVYESTGTVGDDYAHAETFDMIATELWRLRAGIHAMRQGDGRMVPDEEVGFRRVRLVEGDSDEYRPGFDR